MVNKYYKQKCRKCTEAGSQRTSCRPPGALVETVYIPLDKQIGRRHTDNGVYHLFQNLGNRSGHHGLFPLEKSTEHAEQRHDKYRGGQHPQRDVHSRVIRINIFFNPSGKDKEQDSKYPA